MYLGHNINGLMKITNPSKQHEFIYPRNLRIYFSETLYPIIKETSARRKYNYPGKVLSLLNNYTILYSLYYTQTRRKLISLSIYAAVLCLQVPCTIQNVYIHTYTCTYATTNTELSRLQAETYNELGTACMHIYL